MIILIHQYIGNMKIDFTGKYQVGKYDIFTIDISFTHWAQDKDIFVTAECILKGPSIRVLWTEQRDINTNCVYLIFTGLLPESQAMRMWCGSAHKGAMNGEGGVPMSCVKLKNCQCCMFPSQGNANVPWGF